jgi:protein-S-isoprenylcysteine O-methyltransferase Ste14
MSYIFDILIIILLFALYAAVHSFLASNSVKENFKKNFGSLIAFYRFGYNLFSLASLYVIYVFFPKPLLVIYDLQEPYDMIILIPQFMSLTGLFWSFKYICVKEFLGLNQIKRYFNKSYSSELDEELTLTIGGPYKYSRHPVYSFTILFLIFRPTMDLFYLTVFILIVVYFYIGSFYEEKRLLKNFGDVYIKYQNSVSRIFPAFPLRAYDPNKIAEA